MITGPPRATGPFETRTDGGSGAFKVSGPMGVDARILFEQTGELNFEREFPADWKVVGISEHERQCEPSATHEFDTGSRYYGEGHERGSWPEICAVLMLLHACPGVGRVWYGGDSGDGLFNVSPERVIELSRHFMQHGERPYHGR
jgi:hypothetical protein